MHLRTPTFKLHLCSWFFITVIILVCIFYLGELPFDNYGESLVNIDVHMSE